MTDAQAAALDEAIALIAASACTRTWGHTDDGIPCSACRKEAALLAGQLAPIIRRQAEAERDEARAEVVQAIRSERDEARAIARAFGETLDREKDRLILRRQQVKNLAGRLADAEAQRDRLQQIMDEAYSLAAVEVVDLRARLADAERDALNRAADDVPSAGWGWSGTDNRAIRDFRSWLRERAKAAGTAQAEASSDP